MKPLLESLEYEVNNNSCKEIGEERYKRINQQIGKLKERSKWLECLKQVYEDIELTLGKEYHSSGTRLTYKEARRLILRSLRKRFGEWE